MRSIAIIVIIALIALIVLILMFSWLKLIKQAFVSAALSMEEEVKLPPHVGDILLSLAVEEDECCDVAAALPAVGSAMLSQAVEQGGDCLLPPAVGEEYGDCLLRVANSALPSREVERFQGVSSSHEVSSFHEVLGAATQRETLLYKIRVGWEQQRTREENRGSADRVLQYPCDGPTLDRLYELATLDVGDLTQEHRCRLGMQPSCAEMQCLAYLPLCFHVRLCLDLRAETRRLEEARMAYLAELDQAAALRTFFCAGCGQGSAVANCSRESPDRFKLCSGCFTARYCTSECQRSHWSSHRKLCGQQRANRQKRLRLPSQRLFALLDRRSAYEQISFIKLSGSYRERDHALCAFIAFYPGKEFRAVYDSSQYTIYILYREMASTRHPVLYPLRTHGKMALEVSSVRRSIVKTPAHTTVIVDRSAGSCLLCDAAEARILLLPCRHLCLCGECVHARRFTRRCPMCNADIYQWVWTTVDELGSGGSGLS